MHLCQGTGGTDICIVLQAWVGDLFQQYFLGFHFICCLCVYISIPFFCVHVLEEGEFLHISRYVLLPWCCNFRLLWHCDKKAEMDCLTWQSEF